MSVVADFTISGETFELGRLLSFEGGANIELERLVPIGDEIMPYFWVEMADSDLETFERAVRADPLVHGFDALNRVGDETLYAIEWERVPESLVQGIVQAQGALLQGRSAEGYWRFVIRFPDHARLTDFNEFLIEHDIDVQVDRIYTETGDDRRERTFDLTEEQHEAIVSAVRQGYFEVPRGVTLSDLAEELGITRQAASERIRRGTNAIVRGVLLEGREDVTSRDTDDTSE